MTLFPMTVQEASQFLSSHERHYKTKAYPVFAIGLKDKETRGAVIVGRKGSEAVLAHIYCDGVSQGYTLLYGAAWRAAKALGYSRMVL
jgi:hypothetical protein